ncbi:MAG: hypothetical protein KAR13_11360 [Desulfobulbaceae bacterium]|nr:hypothetical protein [Desulfobulbaceae bacterium]
MNKELSCDICGDTIVADNLCQKCMSMERRINDLIETKSTSIRKYLTQKLQEATLKEEGEAVTDKRGYVCERRGKQTLFSPLRRKDDDKRSWTHLPDRRSKNIKDSECRRKTDDTDSKDS